MDATRLQRLVRRAWDIIESHFEEGGEPQRADREDMQQEMALELVRLGDAPYTDMYCIRRAIWAAARWMRREYGTRADHCVRTSPELTAVIDCGGCRRVWL